MKRLVGVLALLVCLSYGLFGAVILTDEQEQELEQTLDELDATLKTQQQTLDEQQIIIDRQQTTIDEQGSLIEQQQTKISELRTSLDEQEMSSMKRSILTAITSLAIGLLIGLLL